jgi:hypothetical protein
MSVKEGKLHLQNCNWVIKNPTRMLFMGEENKVVSNVTSETIITYPFGLEFAIMQY